MSQFVQRHRNDIGIRIALGGGPSRVLRAIVSEGMRLVGVGLAIGVFAAYFLTKTMSGMLFEVGSSDLATYLTVAAAMLAVALIARLLPARRAAGVDPVRTLRVE